MPRLEFNLKPCHHCGYRISISIIIKIIRIVLDSQGCLRSKFIGSPDIVSQYTINYICISSVLRNRVIHDCGLKQEIFHGGKVDIYACASDSGRITCGIHIIKIGDIGVEWASVHEGPVAEIVA